MAPCLPLTSLHSVTACIPCLAPQHGKLVHADSKLEARVREAAEQSDKHRVVLSHLDLLMADINANLNAEDSCTVGFEDLCVIVVRTEVLNPFKPWA